MLNTAAPVAQGPMAAVAPQAQAPADAADDRAFAHALDEAAARQRDAARDRAEAAVPEGTGARADAPAGGRPEAADARPTPGPRAGAARQTSPPQTLVGGAAESASTAPDDIQPMEQSADGVASPVQGGHADQPPPDLAAWMSSLPLPHATVAAVATTGAAGADSPARTAVAGAPAADSTAAATAQMLDATAGVVRGRDATTLHFASANASAAVRHGDVRAGRAAASAEVDAAASGKEAAADTDALAQALSLRREPSAAPRAGLESGTALPALPGHWAGTLNRPADHGGPVQAELQAQVGSNEFAPALGSQLNVMVRDGVDHAQLKLNPAEMGPIEVRISLDGTQAQVDFSAAHAATRQALQDAVPALASALRENGLTLTGGGVFDQAREQRGDARPDGSRSAPGTPATPLDSATGMAVAPRLPRARGVVDLYA
jgi:flagellar hook-length control protein FliK